MLKKWMITSLIVFSIIFSVMEDAMAMQLTSPAFMQDTAIPKKYTCDGINISPALQWSGAPTNTQSFALIVDDPDAPAGDWVHWILFNIPAKVNALREGMDANSLPPGSLLGVNSWQHNRYDGPCPPSKTHRYLFKLYALDNVLQLSTNSNKAQLENAMQGHILELAQLRGLYSRS